MARVLLVWELGSNLGHLATLSTLANALHGLGHSVAVALQRVDASVVWFDPGVLVLQSPLKVDPGPAHDAKIWADLVRPFGWSDAETLCGLVRAWRGLFSLVAPDLIVLDSAPTALLAARDLDLRVIGFSVPFSLPAPLDPLPLWRRHTPECRPREQELVAFANSCTTRPLDKLADLFEGVPWLLNAVPEFDPWLEHRGPSVTHVGVTAMVSRGEPVDWPDGEGPKVFVYARARYRHLRHVMAALEQCRVIVVSTGNRILPRPNWLNCQSAVQLERILGSADLCITHSIYGTGGVFFAAGVPVLLLPMQIEQALGALCAQDLEGIEVHHHQVDSPAALSEHIQALLGSKVAVLKHQLADPVSEILTHLP